MEPKVQYELLLPWEFKERFEAFPLIYIPVGSLEWHGEHLALGNDAIKIHHLCCDAARIGGGIVYPPIYYCIPGLAPFDPSKYNFNGTFVGKEEILEQLLLSILESLENVGFKSAILITGHTPQQQCELMRKVADKYKGKMKVHGTDDKQFANSIGHKSDHAAKWETSILWHYRPELVDITQLPRDLSKELYYVHGDDPRESASPGLGREVSELIAYELAELARKLLERA